MEYFFNQRCIDMLNKEDNETYLEAVDNNTGKRVNKLSYNIKTGEILITYAMSHLRGIIDFASKESEDDWVRVNLVYERKEMWYNTEYAASLNDDKALENIIDTMQLVRKIGLTDWTIFVNTEIVYEP